MNLDCYKLSISLISQLAPLTAAVAKRDRDLASQLKRAASSVSLNIAEGSRVTGGNRLQRFHTAAGSARETLAALQVATAWGYVDASATEEPAEMLDRIGAMLYRLTH